MKQLKFFLYPKSPFVWDGNGFSQGFEDLVLDFGVHAATIAIIFILGIMRKGARTNWKVNFFKESPFTFYSIHWSMFVMCECHFCF